MTRKPYKLGLTGSIAMGKTTTAGFFRAANVPVWDADAVVHRLYSKGGAGVSAVARLVPEATTDGAVNRDALKKSIRRDPALLEKIESVIYPIIAKDRTQFLREQCEAGADLVVFDIPLLFETQADDWLDGVLVVTTPPEVQRERVLSRPEMTEAFFETILQRQMPDHEKKQRADFVIDTSLGLDVTRTAILSLVGELRAAKNA